MGGRGASSGRAGADTSYQGNKGYAKASSSGYTASDMYQKISSLEASTLERNKEALAVIEKVANNPNATITVYRATVGNTINQGDWVFLDEAHAEKWTKTPFGRPKPGVKVVKKKVKASDVDWTGKNLEFMLNKK